MLKVKNTTVKLIFKILFVACYNGLETNWGERIFEEIVQQRIKA